MVKNIIGLVCLGVLLAACEQEEIGNYPPSAQPHHVSIPLSVASGLSLEEHSDYVPMSTKAGDQTEAEIDNFCQCLVLKEIDSKWYVDTFLLQSRLNKALSLFVRQKVKTSGEIGTLDLILSPGHYRILVAVNTPSNSWNPALVTGYKVKEEGNSNIPVPYAFTYTTDTDPDRPNYGFRSLYREIFAGTYEFTVSKTGDLHSLPSNGNQSMSLNRKVSRFRILLKNTVSPKENFPFITTEHFAHLTFETTGDTPFCSGIDCWGDAYYDQANPLETFEMYISTSSRWRVATNGSEYQMVTPSNSTYGAVFLYTDEKKTEGVPFRIRPFRITGQTGNFTYYYDKNIDGHILYPNSIDGIVLQTTDEYKKIPGVYSPEVRVEVIPEENAATLFDCFYEVNQQ